MQGLKAAPKLHSYNSTRKKQWYTKIHIHNAHKKTCTHPKLTEEENDVKKFCYKKINLKKKGVKV